MISFFSFFVKLYLCYHNLFIWTFKKGLEFSFSAVDLLSSWPEKSALPTGQIDLILLNSHLPKRSKYLKMEIEILPSYEIQENQNSDTFCRYADLPNAHSWFCLLLQQHAFSSLSSYFLKSKTKSFLVFIAGVRIVLGRVILRLTADVGRHLAMVGVFGHHNIEHTEQK